MTDKNKGGRPRHGDAAKLAPMNMRTTPELREKIEEAADVNGRSLTQEVERRLLTSFIFDDHYGGPHIHTLVGLVGSTVRAIEEQRGTNWREDAATWEAVKAATERLLRWHRPKDAPDLAWDKVLDEAEAAAKAHKEALKALDDYRISIGIFSVGGAAFDQPFASRESVGLFGGGVRRMIDPRANLTPEQIEEEGRLEAAVAETRERELAGHAALMEYARPRMKIMADARTQGEAIAESNFLDLGPRMA